MHIVLQIGDQPNVLDKFFLGHADLSSFIGERFGLGVEALNSCAAESGSRNH